MWSSGMTTSPQTTGSYFLPPPAPDALLIWGPGGTVYELAPYVANQWYRVDLTLDWLGRTIDVFIDGVPRQYNVPFRSPTTTSLTRLHFYNFDNSTAWLDYIMMSSPPPSLDLFDNGFESADTTAWSLAVPAQPTRLVLFDGGGISGAIGGRSGADVLCGQAAQTATGHSGDRPPPAPFWRSRGLTRSRLSADCTTYPPTVL